MLTFGVLLGSNGVHDLITRALVWVPLLLVSLTIHEFGHAATAYALGDPTPKQQGRVSLNPLAHLDPLGTLMILFGPIGWGKPVQFNPNLLRWRNSEILVSFAGPFMNLVLAVLAACVLKYVSFTGDLRQAVEVVQILFFMNISLAVFNMLPIPPLDGGHIWPAILPRPLRQGYYHLLPYGMIVLIFLVMWPGASAGLSVLIDHAARFIFDLLP